MSHSQHPLDNKLLLGRYRVMRLLGEGGMGTVHLARVEGAEGFTRPVVVKRMKHDLKATDEGHRLFIREAKILSKLQHPSIVGISDFGVEDGAHIMVLEYVHGYPLSVWLEYRYRKSRPFPVDICLFMVRRILDALHYAHHLETEEGREIEVVHRDISPDNVLVSNKGYIHLLDFGIASMRGPLGDGSTKSGAFRGKLCYAAPETVEGKPATPRSDQYSAAVVLLELLTSETPFASESIALTFGRMLNEMPEPPSKVRDDIPPGLDDVLLRALAKDPTQRYDSALAFSRELRRFQADDDEDVTQRLKEFIREEFDQLPREVGVEGLREREAALEKILSIVPGPMEGVGPLKLPPTLLDGRLRPRPAETPAEAIAPKPAPEQRQLRGLLWGLLLVGGVIAVGIGAMVALLSRGGGDDKVVVVGDETSTQSPAVPKQAVPKQPESVPVATSGADVGRAAPSDVASASATPPLEPKFQSGSAGAGATAGGVPASRQEKLAQAVKAKSGAFQACFSENIDPTGEAPRATLHFRVAKEGGAAQVEVEPTALAATPLGSCLKGAGGQVHFPQLDEPVSFRVPVRARVSPSKGQP